VLNGQRRDFEARIVGSGADEALCIVRDITERKKVDQMKNEFISTVSHELRTPLTSIRGSLGLLSGGVAGALPARARAMLDIAYNNSERLVRLINDILDIEKIESGQLDFVARPLELLPLLEQAIDANCAFGAQFDVTFKLEPAVSGIWVNADADRLMQVITNLLSNAARFSPHGQAVTITVTRHSGLIHVAVSDHGPGIPEEFRGRIFQKFAQADSSDTRQRGGTGLGLSISKAIVERLGGEIGFEAGSAIGATFFFDLPEYPIASASRSGGTRT
jgi:signal transduction histidine kinase